MTASGPVEIPVASFDAVDSTMAEADRQAAAGVAGPLLIWARSQTGGEGRHGRPWASPPGNLYWTLLQPRAASWPNDHGLTFAAGLAVCDALADMGVAAERLALKWPNDPLLDGRKVAGVLIRLGPSPAGAATPGTAVIGIGVNLVSHPQDSAFPATSLAAAGCAVPNAATMRDAVTARVLHWQGRWEAGGYAALRDSVEARLHGVGSPARVALDRDRTVVIDGTSLGLDPTGALRLREPGGRVRAILAGDVLPPV